MILSYRNKALKELFEDRRTRGIDIKLQPRTLRRLDALDQAKQATDMKVPGFNFHQLEGKPTRYSVHVNGPWCVTFEFNGENAERVDFEQYH